MTFTLYGERGTSHSNIDQIDSVRNDETKYMLKHTSYFAKRMHNDGEEIILLAIKWDYVLESKLRIFQLSETSYYKIQDLAQPPKPYDISIVIKETFDNLLKYVDEKKANPSYPQHIQLSFPHMDQIHQDITELCRELL